MLIHACEVGKRKYLILTSSRLYLPLHLVQSQTRLGRLTATSTAYVFGRTFCDILHAKQVKIVPNLRLHWSFLCLSISEVSTLMFLSVILSVLKVFIN